MSITLAQYWMGRDGQYRSQLTPEIRANAAETIKRVNALLAIAGRKHIGVNSGWRPAAVNAAIKGAAPRSHHLMGRAIDLSDADDSFDEWCMANLPALESVGLWMEHPKATRRWCHLQTVPPRSRARVFMP